MKDLLFLIIGALLGWFSQWLFYRYQQRDEKSQGPNVVASRIIVKGQVILAVRNIGNDSLTEMEVKIEWEQDGQKHSRVLNQFFPVTGNIESVLNVEELGPSDHYHVLGIPQQVEGGIIDVFITGVGVNSKKLYNTASQIVVGLTPGQNDHNISDAH